ncbi:MAG: GDP-mannose 4,6-dehydratase [Candidatus Eremiobacterota bacterium]
MIDLRRLQGRKVLVTGAGGFIGSHLVEAAVAAGCEVRALVKYNSRGFWGHLETVAPEVLSSVDVMLGDIRDPRVVEKAMDGREVVFHLAALIGIPYSYHAAQSYIETNVLGTLNVLQAALDSGVSRFLQTSTSEVYGSAQYVPMDESHPLRPQSPYAASKVGADQLALSFFLSFDLPVTVVRPFNAFGPRQSARAIIPTIVSQALVGDRITLGSLDPIRDLTYVKDVARAFLHAAVAPDIGGDVINLGTGEGVSVQELVDHVGQILGKAIQVDQSQDRVRPVNSEVVRLISNPARAAEKLGWKYEVSLDGGLKKTVEWIRNNADYYKPQLYAI